MQLINKNYKIFLYNMETIFDIIIHLLTLIEKNYDLYIYISYVLIIQSNINQLILLNSERKKNKIKNELLRKKFAQK